MLLQREEEEVYQPNDGYEDGGRTTLFSTHPRGTFGAATRERCVATDMRDTDLNPKRKKDEEMEGRSERSSETYYVDPAIARGYKSKTFGRLTQAGWSIHKRRRKDEKRRVSVPDGVTTVIYADAVKHETWPSH